VSQREGKKKERYGETAAQMRVKLFSGYRENKWPTHPRVGWGPSHLVNIQLTLSDPQTLMYRSIPSPLFDIEAFTCFCRRVEVKLYIY